MKFCRMWQFVLGIVCTLMTVALGTVTILMLVSLGGAGVQGNLFDRMFDGLSTLTSNQGFPTFLLIAVMFLLPTLALGTSTGLLFYTKRAKNVILACIIALVATVVVVLLTGIFSKTLFLHWQKLYLFLLVGGSVFFAFVLSTTWWAAKLALAEEK